MPNILNLRKEPKPIIIEKVIQEKRVWWLEVLKMVTVITVVSSVVYGISKAADVTPAQAAIQNFSALGTVSAVSTSSLSISGAHSSDKTRNTSYTFDLFGVKKIENRKYVQLSIYDITVGDEVVVQGIEKEGKIDIKRIISFSSTTTSSHLVDATSTSATSTVATSTDTISTSTSDTALLVATATTSIATSTASTTTDTASSSLGVSSSTSAISSSTDSVATTTATSTDIVATSTATTTATIASPTATTTVATSTADNASSTPDMTQTPDPVILPTDTTTASGTTSQDTTSPTTSPTTDSSSTNTQ